MIKMFLFFHLKSNFDAAFLLDSLWKTSIVPNNKIYHDFFHFWAIRDQKGQNRTLSKCLNFLFFIGFRWGLFLWIPHNLSLRQYVDGFCVTFTVSELKRATKAHLQSALNFYFSSYFDGVCFFGFLLVSVSGSMSTRFA